MTDVRPVLVVDDEELLLSFLKTALERGGLNVVAASNGSEALEQLQRQSFSCVVSDLSLPGGPGGAEIHEWVVKNQPELASRFLFITGNISDDHAVSVRTKTGAHFIEKPFRIAHLIELIHEISPV